MKYLLGGLIMLCAGCLVTGEDPPSLPELDDGYIRATINGKEFEGYANTFISKVYDFDRLSLYGAEDSLIYPYQSRLSFSLAYDTTQSIYNIIRKDESNNRPSGGAFREIDYDVTIATYRPIVYEGDSGYVELYHDRNEEGEWIIRGTFSATFLVDINPRAEHLRSYSDTVKVRNGTFKGLVRDERNEDD